MHMALDEVLLGRVIAGERRPTVRFWEWIEPALVIGSPTRSTERQQTVCTSQSRGA